MTEIEKLKRAFPFVPFSGSIHKEEDQNFYEISGTNLATAWIGYDKKVRLTLVKVGGGRTDIIYRLRKEVKYEVFQYLGSFPVPTFLEDDIWSLENATKLFESTYPESLGNLFK